MGPRGVVVGGDRWIVIGSRDGADQCGSFSAIAAVWDTLSVGVVMAVSVVVSAAQVEVSSVGIPTAGHRNVQQGAASVFTEDGVAGVNGHPLGGMHGDRVTEADMLAQVFRFKESAPIVVEPFGNNTIRLGIDGHDAPTISITHR